MQKLLQFLLVSMCSWPAAAGSASLEVSAAEAVAEREPDANLLSDEDDSALSDTFCEV